MASLDGAETIKWSHLHKRKDVEASALVLDLIAFCGETSWLRKPLRTDALTHPYSHTVTYTRSSFANRQFNIRAI
ncbi:uncharacterized protein EAF01_008268 [Botrytis porri]|uniref:uncharacterized protein n=1 Tax=Botrytis porri TaxID=87229 RepID=UPI0019016481|nr:uncharacterized protein EAF01_008268 [Botrytis porri]KAF7899055.1 hypothetical protein EAF01_008268 [Botrytis porri]